MQNAEHMRHIFQKDMFLSLHLQNVPVCHTENTACSQQRQEGAVTRWVGVGYSQGFWHSLEDEAFGKRKGHFSAFEQSCTPP